MFIYLVLALLVIFFSFLDISKYKRANTPYIVLFTVLVLVAGLRDASIGQDTLRYREHYLHIAKNNLVLFEPVFYAITYVCAKVLQISFNFYSLIIVFLSVFIKFRAFRVLAPTLFIPVLYYLGEYYLAHDFNQIRQGLASGVLMLSTLLLYEKKIGKYLLVISFAALIHTSSLFFLLYPVFFFVKRFSNRTLFFIVLVSYLFLFINMNDIILNMLTVFGEMIPSLVIKSKIASYTASELYSQQTGFYPVSVLQLLFALMFITYKKKVANPMYNLLLSIFIVGTCFYFMFNSVSFLLRLGHTALALGGILYAYIIYAEKNKGAKIVLVVFMILVTILKLVGYLNTYEHSFIPYKVFF